MNKEDSFIETEKAYYELLEKLNKEIWRKIKNFEKYEVSNFGRIRIKETKYIMKFCSQVGYHRVTLLNKKKRKTFYVHRLVAKAFNTNPKPNEYFVVDHFNNKVTNLKWCTQSQNMQNHYDNNYEFKLKGIIQIDKEDNIIKEWKSIKEAIEYNPNFKYDTIVKCATGKEKTAYGYKWKYKEEKLEVKFGKDEKFIKIGKFSVYNFSNYETLNYGKIRNIERGNILKMKLTTVGYYTVCLTDAITKKGIHVKVHRLVALKFVEGMTKEKNVVNHIDENKANNYYKNLEWVTGQKNTELACGRKIEMYDLQGTPLKKYDSIKQAVIDNKYGPNSHVTISKCCRGINKTAFGYKWKYLDIVDKEEIDEEFIET